MQHVISLTSALQIWKMLTHSYCLSPVTKMPVSLVSMMDTEVRILQASLQRIFYVNGMSSVSLVQMGGWAIGL